jgi:hypothetical protein
MAEPQGSTISAVVSVRFRRIAALSAKFDQVFACCNSSELLSRPLPPTSIFPAIVELVPADKSVCDRNVDTCGRERPLLAQQHLPETALHLRPYSDRSFGTQ